MRRSLEWSVPPLIRLGWRAVHDQAVRPDYDGWARNVQVNRHQPGRADEKVIGEDRIHGADTGILPPDQTGTRPDLLLTHAE